MNDSKISVRYAKALFDLANERGVLERVKEDMLMISDLLKSVPQFKEMLNSPIVKSSEKRLVMKAVFGDRFHSLTLSFLDLLVTNKREAYLQTIVLNFISSCRKLSGIKLAELTSAHPLDQASISNFNEVIRKYFNTEAEVTCKVNERLIGGFILRVDDFQIDASVNTRFKKLKRELLKQSV